MSVDKQTSDLDARTCRAERQPAPNHVLVGLRDQRGWSRARLAKEFEDISRRRGWSPPERSSIEKTIYRVESGRTQVPDLLYTRLFCETYQKTTQELFGSLTAPESTARACKVRSHKFVPAYVGPDQAARLRDEFSLERADGQWLECHTGQVAYDGATCALYVWPFGVAMFHIREDLSLHSVADLAIFRLRTYEKNIQWAGRQLQRLTGSDGIAASYVLSAYWVDTPIWSGPQLTTALRLMCVPRVLLERDTEANPSLARAELVERALLRDGFDHAAVMDFGIKGISYGLASWSGVVYHPIATDRALVERELVSCELAVQAAWAYCDHIRDQVENGVDPVVPDRYGWRFFRGIRSRLTAERPQETSQHRLMREAVVETSGLARHLTRVVDTLRATNEDLT